MKRFFVWLLRPVVKEILKENATTTNISNVSVKDPRVDELVKLLSESGGLERIAGSYGE